ncbi:Hypothetical_protein [Hexamita inflata]|uniref:Hypothetical_protein n=1 Tax=Hexamita inflata TaxID=28002 RepID=A0AA86RFU5_9EUKA|nr:Hypothetical protein HINF_LOCUS61558 [Hexamita inflata]
MNVQTSVLSQFLELSTEEVCHTISATFMTSQSSLIVILFVNSEQQIITKSGTNPQQMHELLQIISLYLQPDSKLKFHFRNSTFNIFLHCAQSILQQFTHPHSVYIDFVLITSEIIILSDIQQALQLERLFAYDQQKYFISVNSLDLNSFCSQILNLNPQLILLNDSEFYDKIGFVSSSIEFGNEYSEIIQVQKTIGSESHLKRIRIMSRIFIRHSPLHQIINQKIQRDNEDQCLKHRIVKVKQESENNCEQTIEFQQTEYQKENEVFKDAISKNQDNSALNNTKINNKPILTQNEQYIEKQNKVDEIIQKQSFEHSNLHQQITQPESDFSHLSQNSMNNTMQSNNTNVSQHINNSSQMDSITYNNVLNMMNLIEKQYVILPRQNNLQKIIDDIISFRPWLLTLSVKQQMKHIGILSLFTLYDKTHIDINLFEQSCYTHKINQNIHKLKLPTDTITIINGIYVKDSFITDYLVSQYKKVNLNNNINSIQEQQKLYSCCINRDIFNNQPDIIQKQIKEILATIQQQFVIIPYQNIVDLISEITQLHPEIKLLTLDKVKSEIGLISVYDLNQNVSIDVGQLKKFCLQGLIAFQTEEISLKCNSGNILTSLINGVFIKNSRITQLIGQSLRKQMQQTQNSQDKQNIQILLLQQLDQKENSKSLQQTQSNCVEQYQNSRNITQQQFPQYINNKPLVQNINKIIDMMTLIQQYFVVLPTLHNFSETINGILCAEPQLKNQVIETQIKEIGLLTFNDLTEVVHINKRLLNNSMSNKVVEPYLEYILFTYNVNQYKQQKQVFNGIFVKDSRIVNYINNLNTEKNIINQEQESLEQQSENNQENQWTDI